MPDTTTAKLIFAILVGVGGITLGTLLVPVLPATHIPLAVMVGWCGMSFVSGYFSTRLFRPDSVRPALQLGFLAWLTLITVIFFILLIDGSILLLTRQEVFAGSGTLLVQALLFATGGSYLARKHIPTAVPTIIPERIQPNEVAAIIPAHNEELTIAKTISSLSKVLPVKNIHVGSDASTDRTIAIVQELGANVLDIRPNRGKAGVLQYLIDHYKLCDRFKAVVIVDADSEVDEHYLEHALPLFDNPEMGAVAGHVRSKWRPHILPRWSMFTVAYRVRLYRFLQATMRYGQTWKHANVTTIVPGFCSMYRTSALRHIDITAPGLIIEDYNMTFELHHKRLGKVAYSPRAIGYTQDPFRLQDYVRQVKRWNLGFWQTVRRHGIWPSRFWLSLAFFMAEGIFFSIILLALPIIIALLVAHGFQPIMLSLPGFSYQFSISALDLLVGTLLIDYAYTVLIALIERKPQLLVYGLGFIVLRYIDAWIYLYTIYLAFSTTSSGRWVSPMRQAST